MDELETLINNKITNIENRIIDDEAELNFIKNITKNIKKPYVRNFNMLNNIKHFDFFIVAARVLNSNDTFKHTVSKISIIKNQLNEFNNEELLNILGSMNKFKEAHILTTLLSSNPNMISIFKNNLNREYHVYNESIKNNFKKNSCEKQAFEMFFLNYIKSPLITVLYSFECFKVFCAEDIFCNYLNLIKKEKERKVIAEDNAVFKDVDMYNLLVTFFEKLEDYQKYLEDSALYDKKEKKEETKIYYKVLSCLEEKRFEFPIEFNKNLIDKIDDETIKKELIKKIFHTNLDSFNKLEKEFNKNKDNSINSIDKLLLKYDSFIDDPYTKSLLLNENNNIELENKLKFINEPSLIFIKNNVDLFIKTLLFSNNKILSTILSLLTSNIITEEFILKNSDILVNDSKFNEELELLKKRFNIKPLYNTLMSNVDKLGKNNIYLPNIKKYNINLFLMNVNDLANSLKYAKPYGFGTYNNTDLTNFAYLENSDALLIVDQLLELGLKDYIEENMAIVKAGNTTIIKKIFIMKLLGKNIINGTKINSIITEPKFPYCNDDSDDLLDNYIVNDTLSFMNPDCYVILEDGVTTDIKHTHNPYLIELDKQYQQDHYLYNFNGTLISRIKVWRNIHKLNICLKENVISDGDILFNAIIHNSILSNEEIYNIKDCLKKIISAPVLKK